MQAMVPSRKELHHINDPGKLCYRSTTLPYMMAMRPVLRPVQSAHRVGSLPHMQSQPLLCILPWTTLLLWCSALSQRHLLLCPAHELTALLPWLQTGHSSYIGAVACRMKASEQTGRVVTGTPQIWPNMQPMHRLGQLREI